MQMGLKDPIWICSQYFCKHPTRMMWRGFYGISPPQSPYQEEKKITVDLCMTSSETKGKDGQQSRYSFDVIQFNNESYWFQGINRCGDFILKHLSDAWNEGLWLLRMGNMRQPSLFTSLSNRFWTRRGFMWLLPFASTILCLPLRRRLWGLQYFIFGDFCSKNIQIKLTKYKDLIVSGPMQRFSVATWGLCQSGTRLQRRKWFCILFVKNQVDFQINWELHDIHIATSS
jgi:hypothetical protein